jgi:hypothetical protein
MQVNPTLARYVPWPTPSSFSESSGGMSDEMRRLK